MTRSESVRITIKAFTVLALAVTLVVATRVRPAEALPCQENTQQFFDDSSCSVEVGYRIVTCSGETQWGNTNAQYMIGSVGDCCGNCNPGSCGGGYTGCIARW